MSNEVKGCPMLRIVSPSGSGTGLPGPSFSSHGWENLSSAHTSSAFLFCLLFSVALRNHLSETDHTLASIRGCSLSTSGLSHGSWLIGSSTPTRQHRPQRSNKTHGIVNWVLLSLKTHLRGEPPRCRKSPACYKSASRLFNSITLHSSERSSVRSTSRVRFAVHPLN